MSSTSSVVYPPGWKKQQNEFRSMSVFFLVAALVFVVVAATGGAIIFWFAATIATSGSISFYNLCSWSSRSSRAEYRNDINDGTSALMVREWTVGILLGVAAVMLAAPLFVVLTIEGSSAFGGPPPEGTVAHSVVRTLVFLSPAILALVVVMSTWFLLGRVFFRGSLIGVAMTPNGICRLWRGGCSFFPWAEISDIRLMPPSAGPHVKLVVGRYDYAVHPEESEMGRISRMRRWGSKLNLGMLRTHPGLVYQAMFFYLRNPELRDELRDERSVERMKEGDYGDIPTEIETHGRALSPGEVSGE